MLRAACQQGACSLQMGNFPLQMVSSHSSARVLVSAWLGDWKPGKTPGIVCYPWTRVVLSRTLGTAGEQAHITSALSFFKDSGK